jgi:PEP-CTERM motif
MSRHHNHRRILLAAFAFTAAIAGDATADIIYTQSGVLGSSSLGDGDPAHYYTYSQYWVQGGIASSAAGSAPGSSASAAVTLQGDPGIHLAASGTTSVLSNEPFATQYAAGEWQDTARLNGVVGLPAQILADVHVDGFISIVPSQGSIVWQEAASIGIVNYGASTFYPNSPTGAGNVGGSGGSEVGLNVGATGGGPFNQLSHDGTQNFTYNSTTGEISWDSPILLSYDPAYGGYHFNFYASVSTFAESFGDATADFGDTFRLAAMTLPDGSPLPGPITFDSGFQLQAVPEPSSLVTAGIGVLMALAYTWRRRVAGWKKGGRAWPSCLSGS